MDFFYDIPEPFVDKDDNGMGIAKELLAYAIRVAKDNNCYKIILDCNRELIPFYEKSGFGNFGICDV